MASNKKQGLYLITCKTTGRAYAGASVNIGGRWRSHRHQLNKGIHHCAPLQEDYELYGPEDFEWNVYTLVADREDLPEKELALIRSLDNPYNTTEMVHNPMLNSETARRSVATRGDKQSGINGPGAKFEKETYLSILADMCGPLTNVHIAQKYKVSTTTITNIISGKSHKWLQTDPLFEQAMTKRDEIKRKGRFYSESSVAAPSLPLPPRSQVPLIQEEANIVLKKPEPKPEPKPAMQQYYILRHKEHGVASRTEVEWMEQGLDNNTLRKKLFQKAITSYKGWFYVGTEKK